MYVCVHVLIGAHSFTFVCVNTHFCWTYSQELVSWVLGLIYLEV